MHNSYLTLFLDFEIVFVYFMGNNFLINNRADKKVFLELSYNGNIVTQC